MADPGNTCQRGHRGLAPAENKDARRFRRGPHRSRSLVSHVGYPSWAENLPSEGPEALVDRTDTPSFGRKEPAIAPAE
jgi:hypothetical protein